MIDSPTQEAIDIFVLQYNQAEKYQHCRTLIGDKEVRIENEVVSLPNYSASQPQLNAEQIAEFAASILYAAILNVTVHIHHLQADDTSDLAAPFTLSAYPDQATIDDYATYAEAVKKAQGFIYDDGSSPGACIDNRWWNTVFEIPCTDE